jgi:hypothetical protein
VLIGLVDRVIGVLSYFVWIVLSGAPKVGDKAVFVIYGLDARGVRPTQQDCAATEEGLNIVRHVPETLPY